MLTARNILVGVTGSIAAYKSAVLVRLLVRAGASVRVVMTPAAKHLITPLTLSTLSTNSVATEFYNPENGDWHSHVKLGLWANAMLIAPATANTIAKMAGGIADNLLTTTYLSAKCPVFVAPAMDVDMYRHAATQRNLQVLRSYGNIVIEPVEGMLASGLSGQGRMEEPEAIVDVLTTYFSRRRTLVGKRILITAGATHEKIDAVRYLGNYSSGKMGFALAEECADRGADVTVVAGVVSCQTNYADINIVHATSAHEMLTACMSMYSDFDAVIFAAAVADFTPAATTEAKLKRGDAHLHLDLVPTVDIAAEIGRQKPQKMVTVGFALENDNEVANAIAKLQRKNLDFIVLNSMNDNGAGFNHDTNKITIINRQNDLSAYELKPKKAVAIEIIDMLEKYLKKS